MIKILAPTALVLALTLAAGGATAQGGSFSASRKVVVEPGTVVSPTAPVVETVATETPVATPAATPEPAPVATVETPPAPAVAETPVAIPPVVASAPVKPAVAAPVKPVAVAPVKKVVVQTPHRPAYTRYTSSGGYAPPTSYASPAPARYGYGAPDHCHSERY